MEELPTRGRVQWARDTGPRCGLASGATALGDQQTDSHDRLARVSCAVLVVDGNGSVFSE